MTHINYILCFFIGLLLMAFPAFNYHTKWREALATKPQCYVEVFFADNQTNAYWQILDARNPTSVWACNKDDRYIFKFSYSGGRQTARATTLAAYYEEFKLADPEVRQDIGRIVAVEFRDFNSGQLVNGALKQFLIDQRGY